MVVKAFTVILGLGCILGGGLALSHPLFSRIPQRSVEPQSIPTPPPPLPSPQPTPSLPFPRPFTVERYQVAVDSFIRSLESTGSKQDHQAVLLLDPVGNLLGKINANRALPVASLTKLATSLAALRMWGSEHQFETRIYAQGSLVNDTWQGDLWLEGDIDAAFSLTFSDLASLTRRLHNFGIQEIRGDLYLTGSFDGLNVGSIHELSLSLPKNIGIPIQGQLIRTPTIPEAKHLLLRYTSQPLRESLYTLNSLSKNHLADLLTQGLGGIPVLKGSIAEALYLDPSQIHLVNGSGLAYENQLSAQIVADILLTMQAEVDSLSDILPEAGIGESTLNKRNLPLGTVAKTGSLGEIVTLAGQLPNGIFFVLLNRGSDPEKVKGLQDQFLHDVILINSD